jgi:hypothetical protein
MKTMEFMWQNDLKLINYKKTPPKIGCFYFTNLKKQLTNPGATMYSLDKEGRKLNYDQERKSFFVPIGKKL